MSKSLKSLGKLSTFEKNAVKGYNFKGYSVEQIIEKITADRAKMAKLYAEHAADLINI
jgi:hypothetical protein